MVTSHSERWRAWQRLLHHKMAVVAGVFLAVVVVAAIFADVIAPGAVDAYDISHAFLPPGASGHLFGTDDIGRDVFGRVVHGARVSITIGCVAVGIAATVGAVLGLAAGYRGGRTDMVISRGLDVLLSFPGILLAITIVAGLGPGLPNVMLALGIAGVPAYARVVRGTTLAARNLGYVGAAVAIGMSEWRVMLRHVLPNIVGAIIVMITLGFGDAIISAAGLSFLGLGATAPTPDWGLEASNARTYLKSAPWISGFNGLALALTVLAVNLFGDGLREALDPQEGR
jgi:peptide/nickel transport system permease protein